jgi:hypothetical protein
LARGNPCPQIGCLDKGIPSPGLPKLLVKQCRPTDKIVVTGPATLRISRRAIVTVSAKEKGNVRIE